MTKIKSLQSTIVFRLIIPVILFIIIIESAFSYLVTLHNVEETYDRWLLDSARSLEQEVKVIENEVSVKLSDSALKIFKWNHVGATYFKIQAEHNGLLAGDLPSRNLSPPLNDKPMLFSNILLNGEELRMVTITVSDDLPENVTIHVAETLHNRRQRFTEILIANLAPQLLLTLLIGIFLYKGVKRGLTPLHKLTRDIAQRSPSDLSPVDDYQDFEEVKILSDTINNLFEKLSLSINAQQQFIANAAHQLRTPLAGLNLQAERAQREQNIETMRPALTQIQSSAVRISHMISQLLVLARSDQVEESCHFESLDLLQLSKSICMEWVPKALENNISLSFESLEKSVFIEGNEILLSELLANLLDNAISYGNPKGHIVVKLTQQPFPSLIIEDDGPGIKQTEYNKVFDRFYRIPGSSGKGCGLGLAIVKEIADSHHIKLSLEKSNLGGVKFELLFPNTHSS